MRPLTPEARGRLEALNDSLAGQALRVLALAYKDVPADRHPDDLAGGLVFVGLVGMIDPLREEVKAAVETCRAAGIRAVMITGDQPATAAEIGRQLGLHQGPGGRPLGVVHGSGSRRAHASRSLAIASAEPYRWAGSGASALRQIASRSRSQGPSSVGRGGSALVLARFRSASSTVCPLGNRSVSR